MGWSNFGPITIDLLTLDQNVHFVLKTARQSAANNSPMPSFLIGQCLKIKKAQT